MHDRDPRRRNASYTAKDLAFARGCNRLINTQDASAYYLVGEVGSTVAGTVDVGDGDTVAVLCAVCLHLALERGVHEGVHALGVLRG